MGKKGDNRGRKNGLAARRRGEEWAGGERERERGNWLRTARPPCGTLYGSTPLNTAIAPRTLMPRRGRGLVEGPPLLGSGQRGVHGGVGWAREPCGQGGRWAVGAGVLLVNSKGERSPIYTARTNTTPETNGGWAMRQDGTARGHSEQRATGHTHTTATHKPPTHVTKLRRTGASVSRPCSVWGLHSHTCSWHHAKPITTRV